MKLNPKNLAIRLGLALCLALAMVFIAVPAYAESVDLPSEEEILAYEEDGSLEERIAYQESLDDAPSDGLLRLMSAAGAQNEFDTRGTMPRTGEARVVAVRVAFPAGEYEEAMTFDEDDTVEALDAIIDGNAHEYPYESLAAYYWRSSYGKLTISGDAYDYVAAHPRSYYEYDDLFVKEILMALDEQVNFADYDGNNDGIIDCIAIHFAGEDTGWGSMWWSNASLVSVWDEEGNIQLFDGKAAGSRVLLHRPSNTEVGVRTLIHEVGHTLGLTDYYQSPWATDVKRGGIQTSDMMNDNIGDHDGFSKWLLGWLDESQVTWVSVSEDGVVATRAGESVGTLTEDGLMLDLEAFTSNDVTQTGGIIVIADHGYDKFSNYYVLQYDNFAGNQSVFWGVDTWAPLSSGFRLYRVMATLDDWGYTVKSNTEGKLHDQLIELVDPDGDYYHEGSSEYGIVPTATDGERWGCMLYAGDSVTPSTSPSTNFYESASAGWTGISIDVVRSDATSGTVVVSFDESEKPSSEPPTLTLLEGSELVCGSHLIVLADTNVTLAPSMMPRISLDTGESVFCTSAEVMGSVIRLGTEIDTDLLAAATSAQIVFEEGTFLLYGGVVSPEIRVDVPIGGVELSDSGALAGGSFVPGPVSLTEVLTGADGTRYFYQCDHERPFVGERTYYKNIIDANDPTKVTKVLVEGDEVAVAKEVFLEKSVLSETSPADRIGYLVPEGADFGDYTRLLDACEANGRIYVLSQDWDYGGKLLSVYDKSGALVGSVTMKSTSHNYGRVLVGPTGVVAVTLYTPFYDVSLHELTYFFDASLNEIDTLTTNGNATSYWLEDGRFITYGWRNRSCLVDGSTIENPYFALCYDVTVPLGEAASAGGWTQYQGAWYYQDENGRWLTNSWLNYEGAWYYFAADGKCQSNTWIQYGGNWYYLGPDGKAVANDWVNYKGNWYYLDENGHPLTNSWLKYGDSWYRFAADGKCLSSTWIQYSGNWYYFGPDGKVVANDWVNYKGNWYYLDENGHPLANSWLNYSDAWYHFAADGKCQSSAWVQYGGNWYYLGPDGKAVANDWVKYNGSWYYLGANGAAVSDTWAPYNGREYYINSKGVATGQSRAIA